MGRRAETAPDGSKRRSGQPRLRKSKWDAQPTQPAEVLIATTGVSVPSAVIRRACELSAGRPVAVLTIARVYGSSFGLPNPGLLPTKREMDEQRAVVNDAIESLESSGVEAWGQVAATRHDVKTIVRAAQAHGVTHVLVVSRTLPRWKQFLEGDTARDVRRRIGKAVMVEGSLIRDEEITR